MQEPSGDGTRTHDEELAHRLILTALASGLNVRVRVSGLSMTPTLLPGERVTVRPLAQDEIPKVGAVACAAKGAGSKSSAQLVVHRVVGHDDGLVVTQGDSNLRPDRAAARTEIVGIVTTRHCRICRLSLGDGLWSRWMTGAAGGTAHRLNNLLACAMRRLLSLRSKQPTGA